MNPLILTAVVVILGLAVSFFLAMTNYDHAEYDPFAKAIGRKVIVDVYHDYIFSQHITTSIAKVVPDEYDTSMVQLHLKNGFVVVIKRSSYHVDPFTHYSVVGVSDDDTVIEYRVKFL